MACVLAFGLHAQDKDYTPTAGNYAIGFDATPIFRYVGNMFNGTGTNGQTNEFAPLAGQATFDGTMRVNPNASIFGKYMWTDKIGFVANIGILSSNETFRAYIQDDKAAALDPLSDTKVIDAWKLKSRGMSILLGGEYRVGEGRIQGVFGGGLVFAFEKRSNEFTWGNQMTDVNQNPTSTAVFPAAPVVPPAAPAGQRNLEVFTTAPNFAFGVTGNAGVEYFIAPRVALGAQVSLLALWEKGRQDYRKYETFDAGLNKVVQKTDLLGPGDSAAGLTTQNLGGSIYISFYF